jgi:acetyltransferase-like isoleucine patch superfamily enzyme
MVTIEKNTIIGDFCNIYGQGGCRIGEEVMIASCVQIVPNQHTFKDIDKSIMFQENIAKGIEISKGSWIGTNVVILDDVTIGKNSIIGAGSVVNKNVDDFTVVAGVPAKVIKTIANKYHETN